MKSINFYTEHLEWISPPKNAKQKEIVIKE